MPPRSREEGMGSKTPTCPLGEYCCPSPLPHIHLDPQEPPCVMGAKTQTRPHSSILHRNQGTHLPQERTRKHFPPPQTTVPTFLSGNTFQWSMESAPRRLPPAPWPFLPSPQEGGRGFGEHGCLPSGVSQAVPPCPRVTTESRPHGAVGSPQTGFTRASENEKLY